ncbi:MAG: DsbA family protein [Chloroflexi bacterium]|nr:DsbA family protein [Chloroflexota bacterium]
MLTPSTHKKRKPLSPFLHLLIPVAFILGLGSGYLLWGQPTPPAAAGTTEVQRVNVSTDGDPSIGPEDAPVTIVEFSDYQCPYCASWYQQTFDRLIANYPGQIRFVYRDLPLPMHPEAIPAAEAAHCAGEQDAYWKFHDALFSGQYDLGRAAYEQYAADLGLEPAAFTACLDDHRYQDEVRADAADATSLGLTGTPSFVINGRILIGALPFEDFKAIIDEELAVKP